jgi:predicted  nucleic acid-binding Zn-ribbon protein
MCGHRRFVTVQHHLSSLKALLFLFSRRTNHGARLYFSGYLRLITFHKNPFLTLQGEIMSAGRIPPTQASGKPIGPPPPTSGDTKDNSAAGSAKSHGSYLQEPGPVGRVSGGPAAGRAAVPGAVQTPTVYSQEPPSYQALRVAQAAVDTARHQVDQVQIRVLAVDQEYHELQRYLDNTADTKKSFENQLGVVLADKEKVSEEMEFLRDKYPEDVGGSSYQHLEEQLKALQKQAETINQQIVLGEGIPATLQNRMNNLEGKRVEARSALNRLTGEVNASIAALNAAEAHAHADFERLSAAAHPQPPQG